ncbi:hypothetical protein TeGR_g412 [Tetraparma gracilis]|uniref:Uncharacterized protein n=1 Tax=Tetraparma gracilis TaxID=2962635 RepID=A0ABQ6MCU7_9STRA|nr:hypothetical protein TeGR_g412 [Tetraparma gracilis]
MTAYTSSLASSLLSASSFSSSKLALSKCVTLLEATDPPRQQQAAALLHEVSSRGVSGGGRGAFRLGIAGPPGAGKSTFIEALGKHVLSAAAEAAAAAPEASSGWLPERMAVLTIDPSSSFSGGSILGDKTRMPFLSLHPSAFVRPSPSRLSLGGLSAYTSDVVQLCTCAGFELVVVETVGLGQSEVEVDQAVDMLLLLVPPAGGDELQGSKKGIVECADMMVVNKADGERGV